MGATMEISFDEAKRQWTLEQRGLDFADAIEVLQDRHIILNDDRKDYPEPRFVVYGMRKGRLIMFAFTPTGNGMRIISMRKCNVREQRKFDRWVG